MKKFLISSSISISVFAFLLTGLYQGYKIGLVEKYMSIIPIPFNWFYEYDLISVKDTEVLQEGSTNISDYKKNTEELKKTFNLQNKERPSLSNINIDSKSLELLNKEMDQIYGLDNTYINQAIVSGISQTKYGWGPIITFSVLDDTEQVKNIDFTASIEDGKIKHLTKLRETQVDYWPTEIPNDFNQSVISKGVLFSKNYFKDKKYESEGLKIPNSKKELIKFFNNKRLSGIYLVYSDSQIIIEYSIGTDSKIEKLNFIYDLDKDSVTEIK